MPGFIDVTGWTSEEVRRLGHADDDYETPRQTWKPRAKPASVKHSVDNVWGAACAAQRINGAYIKATEYRFDENLNHTVVAKHRNRDIMADILANPAVLTVEDIAQGQACRKFLEQDLTLRALKSQLSGFDESVKKVVAVTEEFDTVTHKLELAVVACLPASCERTLARQGVDSRVRQTTGEYVGAVDTKVALNVEVVSATYSQTYGIFWVTAITQDNQAVFFSNKEKFDAGTHLTIKGTIKAHRDGKTQLNRVKVI
jgi:hypothetical protein